MFNWKRELKRFRAYYEAHWWVTILIIGLLILMTGMIEHLFGRLFLCKCDYVLLWYNNGSGPGDSQHLFDWYSLSHVIHGVLFFAILGLMARKLPLRTKIIIAVLMECAWEIFENSPMIISRYQTATISVNYFGDSIINSIFDIFSMILGFIFTSKFKKWYSIAFIIFLELVALFMIRDNLTLNVINLIFPTEIIKNFQSAAPQLIEINIKIFQRMLLSLLGQ